MFAPDQLRKLENEYLRLLDTAAAACAAAAKAHDELMAARTARATQDLLKERSTERLAVPDLTLLETQAELRYYSVLYSGVAGSPEAHAAHTEWMAARTARATQDAQDLHPQRPPALLRREARTARATQDAQDAQDTAKTSEGDTGVKFNYAPTLAQHVSSEGWEL